MLTLGDNITNLERIGSVNAKRLNLLGINTIRDLLFYFPFRYDSFEEITNYGALKPNTKVNITGQVLLIQNRKSPRKKMSITEALVANDSGEIKVIWFNQPFLTKNLHTGDHISLAGKIESDYGSLVMKSPSYEKIQGTKKINTAELVPVYNSTANLTQKQIRFFISLVLNYRSQIMDWVPGEIIKRHKLLSLNDAIEKIHFPSKWEDVETSRKRLGFDELFLLTLQSQINKLEIQSAKANSIKFNEELTKKFVQSLPFKLTDAQKKAAWEILKDIENPKPMARLLEGDVGSGKTVVAAIPILNTVNNKKQAALMVPTEILADQHYESFIKTFKGQKINIGILTNSLHKATSDEKISKAKLIEKINKGEIDLIIGTHALIQTKVKFKNLSFAIIDEQHRFGVEQRKTIIKKAGAKSPHLLSMTATPIPRSLALTIYGDLDISIINEMPKNRKIIKTQVVPDSNRTQVYSFIKKQIASGRQVFVICPLIDISDKLGLKSVTEEFKKLNEQVFPDIPMDMLHGKLKIKEKEAIMNRFLNSKTKILVSTSVIEVGIDIPNATIMMIEDADRFGLAQLHQFRGRVGRGEHQSYCFLFTDNNSEKSRERLSAMEKHHDGFSLAKIDLEFRGPGEVFGTAQKGFPDLKIANLFDYPLVKAARDEANDLVKKDPHLIDHPDILTRLKPKDTVDYLKS